MPDTLAWRRLVVILTLIMFTAGCYSVDCVWWDTAEAWIDQNENGVWDSSEQPLSEVRFHIDDVRNDHQGVGDEAISNKQGKADLRVWMAGCPTVELEVYATPPDGYRFTTPSRIAVPKSATGNPGKTVFSFGFVAESE